MRRIIFLTFLFAMFAGSPAFADPPKILKLSDVKPGTEAVGFSVFKGAEPQPFNVTLGEAVDAGGFPIILSRISGGPMEMPLEKIGAIAGMSGSPIFVGDCVELEECIRKALLPDNNVFLVGALSYALGYFIENGPNAGLTPAEYMLGAGFDGYMIARQFMARPPNKVIVYGREFKNLILFSGINGSSIQGGAIGKSCDESVKSDIKPGSMVSVFLARGSQDISASGTVTWRDGDTIYIFGHPFFGTGQVNYPFVQVSVADTLQTPFQAHKIVGCRLKTEGAMFMDGMYEMGGVIGRPARMLPLAVEIHAGQAVATLNEYIAESPLADEIIAQLPLIWAEQLMGDTNNLSVGYSARITITNQPGVFLRGLVPAQLVKRPFVQVFSKVNAALNELRTSGFVYNTESIQVRIDLIRQMAIWTAKQSFLSQNTAETGETIYANIVLSEWFSGAIKQISVPIKVPEDFTERVMPQTASNITVTVQSANKFIPKAKPKEIVSLEDLVAKLTDSGGLKTNVLYVQQVMPRTRAERDSDEKSAKSSVKPAWNWNQIEPGDLRLLPQGDTQEVVLSVTPELDHFINFEKTFTISVNPAGKAPQKTENNSNNRKWFFLYLF